MIPMVSLLPKSRLLLRPNFTFFNIYKNSYVVFTKLNKSFVKDNATSCIGDKHTAAGGVETIMVNKKMSSTLYKNNFSPPARAVLMIVDLLGLKMNMEDMDPVSRDQDEPQYIKMNPMRTIPILDEGDFSLGDSHAIMIYLCEKYGKAEHSHLYPTDLRKRATVNQRLFLECGILFPRLRAIMAPTYFGRLTELSIHMKNNMDDAYRMLEDCLSQSKYIADDVVTIADFSIYTTTQSLDGMHPVDEKRFPKVRNWLKSMSELDVVKRVNEPFGALYGPNLLRIMDINKENQQSKSKL